MEATVGSRRRIIKIDLEKCTGCGDCIPNCPEGALQVIDGKARLVSDLFCDGLGACIGSCPEDAIAIEEREAEAYDEKRVMENIVPQGTNTIRAHLRHLREHGAEDYYREAVRYLEERHVPVPPLEDAPEALPCGCPGTAVREWGGKADAACGCEDGPVPEAGPLDEGRPRPSELRQWPVHLMLVPTAAPYLRDAELVIAADCVPFACADFHEDFLRGKALLVGCPKLDDADYYEKKLATIFAGNNIRSVTVVHMEVPCCFGLVSVVKNAIETSGKTVPFAEVTVGVKGDILARA
jgi:NAD-dependent dihydropyrimidine dehydrogenase PreA subunit